MLVNQYFSNTRKMPNMCPIAYIRDIQLLQMLELFVILVTALPVSCHVHLWALTA